MFWVGGFWCEVRADIFFEMIIVDGWKETGKMEDNKSGFGLYEREKVRWVGVRD